MQVCWAGDGLRITLPRRTQLTPVQRLNREGVDAVKKHDYERAGVLFYRAYLYDPTDPFTLNNLGYVSELQGELDRARRFYDLALKQSSTADIDRSNAKGLEGKPMIMVASKMDVANPEKLKTLRKHCKKRKMELYEISAVTGQGIQALKYAMGRLVAEIREGTYAMKRPVARKASSPRKARKKVQSVRRIPKRAAFKKRKS